MGCTMSRAVLEARSSVSAATAARAARVGRAAVRSKDQLDAWVAEKRTTEPSEIRTA